MIAYRKCSGCSDGSYAWDNKSPRPVASLLVFISSIAPRYTQKAEEGPRKQKSSGSAGLCADCIAKICDGKPLPKKLRDGIADACKALGIQLQRALPLEVKPAKRRGMIRSKP